MKMILIYLLSMVSLEAKTFQDLQIEDGTYTWLRLNSPGSIDTRCVLRSELPKLTVNPILQGSVEIRGDSFVSKRSYKACTITEQLKLVGVDGPIANLKLESIETNGCQSIDEIRWMSLDRPYDNENISFSSQPHKLIEIHVHENNIVEMRRRNSDSQCFYMVKR